MMKTKSRVKPFLNGVDSSEQHDLVVRNDEAIKFMHEDIKRIATAIPQIQADISSLKTSFKYIIALLFFMAGILIQHLIVALKFLGKG